MTIVIGPIPWHGNVKFAIWRLMDLFTFSFLPFNYAKMQKALQRPHFRTRFHSHLCDTLRVHEPAGIGYSALPQTV